ncbi:MAG: hypothetical protein H3C51_09505 [Rubellimicrobium sp.]|nr:hypothetical protein [Rubellimicrobium sp.]
MPAHAGARATACLALADGTIFSGQGYGATGEVTGTLVFDTHMSGYQEVLSDPAQAGHIVTFTFPHIGNTGTTPGDDRSSDGGAAGLVTAQMPTEPSNWQATATLPEWLAGRGMIGIGEIDTRRLTLHLRDHGAQGAALSHDPEGRFDTAALVARARAVRAG